MRNLEKISFQELSSLQILCERRLERLSRKISFDGTGREEYDECLKMIEKVDNETARRIKEFLK